VFFWCIVKRMVGMTLKTNVQGGIKEWLFLLEKNQKLIVLKKMFIYYFVFVLFLSGCKYGNDQGYRLNSYKDLNRNVNISENFAIESYKVIEMINDLFNDNTKKYNNKEQKKLNNYFNSFYYVENNLKNDDELALFFATEDVVDNRVDFVNGEINYELYESNYKALLKTWYVVFEDGVDGYELIEIDNNVEDDLQELEEEYNYKEDESVDLTKLKKDIIRHTLSDSDELIDLEFDGSILTLDIKLNEDGLINDKYILAESRYSSISDFLLDENDVIGWEELVVNFKNIGTVSFNVSEKEVNEYGGEYFPLTEIIKRLKK